MSQLSFSTNEEGISYSDDEGQQRSLLKDPLEQLEQPPILIRRLAEWLDEFINVKLLMRLWGPRLELLVRFMLVATFLDDSVRVGMNFSNHVQQVAAGGYPLSFFMPTSPTLAHFLSCIVLGIGLLCQICGSFVCLVAQTDAPVLLASLKGLIGWTILQPVLYAQLTNVGYISESATLLGGLLMFHARPFACKRTQLLGRLLLPAKFLYRGSLSLYTAFVLRSDINDFADHGSKLSEFILNVALILIVVVGSTLVAIGLKSRATALLLALINLSTVIHKHPFLLFVWRENGVWKYSENMEDISIPSGVDVREFAPWQIFDLHRYYFFLGLSTSGALMLLAQCGPGEIAVRKNESLLPTVSRAQD